MLVDPSDPIIQVYERAFPDLFTSESKANSIIPGIVNHFRYPEDIFQVQTTMYGRYHLTNVVLHLANGWMLWQLAIRCGLHRGTALLGATAWTLSIQVIPAAGTLRTEKPLFTGGQVDVEESTLAGPHKNQLPLNDQVLSFP